MPRHSKRAKQDAIRRLIEDANRNGGAPNFLEVSRHCDVSDRTLRRWWEDQGSLNIEPMPSPVVAGNDDTGPSMSLAHAVQHEPLSSIWLTLLIEADRDIVESRQHGSMGSVPALRKLQIELVKQFKAAEKEEGSARPRTPEEVEERLRASARSISPRHARVLVEELRKKNLA